MGIGLHTKTTTGQWKRVLQVILTRLIITAILFLPGSLVLGQPQTLDSLVTKFSQYRIKNLQEKLFVHTDRSFYLTGETLWFKIYCVDGTLHRPLELSKIAYVEILDKESKALVQTKVAMVSGNGDGSMFLPASLPSGNYLVRAYTRWMRNFNPDLYFHEVITIVNPFTRLGLVPAIPHYDIQFFPEGGSLVYGLRSKIGFRAVDSQGKGIECTGIVLTDRHDTVARFRPLKFGLGNFSLTPIEGETYKIVIRDKEKHVYTFAMPEIREEGFVMHLTDTVNKIKVEVLGQIKSSSSIEQFVYFLIHTRQVVKLAEKHVLFPGNPKTLTGNKPGDELVSTAKLRAVKSVIWLDKKNLGEGISHITVFNGELVPVCERLYFRSPETKLQIDARCEQGQLSTRMKVKLSVLTHIPKGNSRAANLSVAVFKTDSLLSSGDAAEIGSYLWLTSELKGTIESPAYYFNASGDTVIQAVDNLMLTHGWSRFRWEDILKPKKNAIDFMPEYRGHIILGRVIDDLGAPGSGVITFLSSPGRNVRLYPSRGNEKGNVQFELKDFYGSRKIIVQTNIEADSSYKVEISNPFSDHPFFSPLPAFRFSTDLRNQVADRSLHMQVQNTFNEGKNIRYTVPAIDSSGFYGIADEHYKLDDYTRFPTMEEVLREYVPGVVVRKRKGKFRLMTLDIPGKSLFHDNPLVLLDGVPVFDIDKIMAFDPRKVKQLDVLTRRYFLGPVSFQGISSFTTYHGDLSDFEPDVRSLIMNYEGLQPHREFFSPQYETQQQHNSRVPDTRSLLYWRPTLQTDAQGKQQCEFYTPDVEGKYKIVIQGITRDGIPGSTDLTFEVKGVSNY